MASKSYPGSPIKSNGFIKSNGLKSNLVQESNITEEKPQLPQKTTVGSGGPGRKLPAPPPPPAPPAKMNGVHHQQQPQLPLPAKPRGLTGNGIPPPLRNGHGGNSVTKLEVYTNSHFDHEEGTSVDDIDEIDEDYNSEDDRSSPPGTKLIIGSPIGKNKAQKM